MDVRARVFAALASAPAEQRLMLLASMVITEFRRGDLALLAGMEPGMHNQDEMKPLLELLLRDYLERYPGCSRDTFIDWIVATLDFPEQNDAKGMRDFYAHRAADFQNLMTEEDERE